MGNNDGKQTANQKGGDTVSAITKIFGMFNKPDDIVYEPIKLVCDILRQPLKQIDVHNEKMTTEHKQKLEMELKQFEADLEHEKKVREMKLSIKERRLSEEINQMILDNDFARQEKMIQLEAKYRKEMALVGTEIEQIILNITAENRDKLYKLYFEHEKRYIEVQNAYTDSVYANVAKMKELFPGEAGTAQILDYMTTYIRKISDGSLEFTKQLKEDLKKVIGVVDIATNATSNLAAKYLHPASPNRPILPTNDPSEGIAGEIEHQ